MAGQSYHKRQDYARALRHYNSLKYLDPKNQQYGIVAKEIAAHIPAPRTPLASRPVDPAVAHRRSEHKLNEVIPVQIVGGYGSGQVEHMTVREYQKRKAEEGRPAAVRRPLNY